MELKDLVLQRKYEQIFTGTNQEEGYDKPFLEFDAKTICQILYADNLTYFHYPNIAPIVPLSASGLIECGAIPGSIPYEADKIWKKNANYKKYINWGDSSEPHTGLWLCAWLSAGYVGQTPVWIDRYYNPGYKSGDSYFANTSAVYDEPSTLKFEPGVWYKYFHIGDIFNEMLINSLTGLTSTLKVHLENWESPITVDSSIYENNASLENNHGNMISTEVPCKDITGVSLKLNGIDEYGQVVYDDSFELRDKITVSFWGRVFDWNNVKNSHLLSKNLRGGWSIGFNSGFDNPFFTTFSRIGSGLFFSNSKIYQQKFLPETAWITSIGYDTNYFTWLLDAKNQKLFKIDYDGNIDTSYTFSSIRQLSSLAVGPSSLFVLQTNFGPSNSLVHEFDFDASLLGSTTTARGTKVKLLSSGAFVVSNENDLVIDNENRKWEALTVGGIKKTFQNNSNLTLLSAITASHLNCDSTNNIWALYNQTNYIKINADTEDVILSGSIGNSVSGARGISLIRELQNGIYQDFIWFSYEDEQLLYKTDKNGVLMDTINLSPFDVFPVLSNFTSYEYNRTFNYLPNKKIPSIDATMFFGTQYEPVCGKYTLSYPTSSLATNSWHLFSITYDGTIGDYIFYVDCVERERVSIPDAEIYYNYENSLFLGANAGKINTLGKELKTNSLYFQGNIDDVRIYDCVLNNFDLWRIYTNQFPFKDLKWNMPTGNQSYVEEIERFFKFKLPGSKSQFYNIKLIGLQISDLSVRQTIEGIIKDTVQKVAPIHTELYKIIWE